MLRLHGNKEGATNERLTLLISITVALASAGVFATTILMRQGCCRVGLGRLSESQ